MADSGVRFGFISQGDSFNAAPGCKPQIPAIRGARKTSLFSQRGKNATVPGEDNGEFCPARTVVLNVNTHESDESFGTMLRGINVAMARACGIVEDG